MTERTVRKNGENTNQTRDKPPDEVTVLPRTNENGMKNGNTQPTNGHKEKEEVENGDIDNHNKQLGDKVLVPGHPLLAHKLTILRSSATSSGTFRAVLREVTYHLGYEASSRLTLRPVTITVPMPCSGGKSLTDTASNGNAIHGTSAPPKQKHVEWPHGQKLKEKIALIPILRSGLGMVDAMLALFPNAAIHHIGMYKVLGQNPVQYFNRLPRNCTSDVAFVLDPVIQTSSTVMSVISILKKWGVAEIKILSVVASRAGLQQLIEAHPDIYITVGTIDEQINDTTGVVLPGLGDAGDRQFGTASLMLDEDEDEALLHPSKRKRTIDS